MKKNEETWDQKTTARAPDKREKSTKQYKEFFKEAKRRASASQEARKSTLKLIKKVKHK